jgi:hypothetical protein
LKMSFEEQLKALIFYHLEEHVSGRHLIQVLKEDGSITGLLMIWGAVADKKSLHDKNAGHLI